MCKYTIKTSTGQKQFDSSNEFVDFLANGGFEEIRKDLEGGISTETNEVLEEPSLEFKSDKGNTFESFKGALKDSNGGNIQAGISTKEGFQTLVVMSSNTNVGTYNGFINNMIKEEILSDEKITEDGKSYHKAAGNDQALQLVNERILKDEAVTHLNSKNIKIYTDGRIELADAVGTVSINGENVSISEIRNATTQELTDRFGKEMAMKLAINNALKDSFGFGANKEKVTQNEGDLKLKLLDLLNTMGVKTMSIQDYVQKYNNKNGVDPDAKALVDIAQQVIAFKDGVISTKDLTEETAHFIVEAWGNNPEIENLLRNVHRTESYQEHSKYYRELYSAENPNMSVEEVENLVRREVLGKELSKALTDIFNTDGKTDIQSSIIRKLYELFMQFFNSIVVKDEFKKDLESLTLKVEDLLLSKDINNYLNLEQTKTKKFRMYQAQASGDVALDAKANVAKILVQALLDQEKTLVKAGVGSKAEIQRLNEAMDKALTKSSALELIKLSKRHAIYLSGAIKDAQKRGQTLSNEEGIVLHNMKENIVPLLERLNVLVKDDENLKDIGEDINKVLLEIGYVKGDVANAENNILNKIVDRLLIRHNVDESHRAELVDAIDHASRDTQLLYSWFGQITHAHDPLLNLLGSVISDMTLDAEQRYLGRIKKWQARMRELGFAEKDLQKFYDRDGYILSQYDWVKFEGDVLNTRASLYKQYANSELSVEEIATKLKDGSIDPIEDKDAEKNYKDAVTKEINTYVERSFTDEYYEGREQRFKDLGISDVTRTFLRLHSTDLGQLMSRVKTEKGLPRYKYQDRHNLDGINLRRRRAKSLFDDLGNLKKGIVETAYPEEGTTIEQDGKFYKLDNRFSTEAIEEAVIAFEVNKIDLDFIKTKNDEVAKSGGQKIDIDKLAPKFLEELDRIEKEEGREAAAEFFLLNTTVGFSNDFWNSFEATENIQTLMDSYSQRPDADQAWIDEIESYKSQSKTRKALLKQYQDSKNYTNILASEMTTSSREEIKNLSESIDRSYSLLYSLFKGELNQADRDQEARPTETTPNQAYYEALEDERRNTVEEKLEFSMKNMTAENAKKVRQFGDALDDVLLGRHVSENQKMLIKRLAGINDLSELKSFQLDDLKLQYAESKLLPYYKAFAPAGLADFYKQLKVGNGNVTNLVTNLNSRSDVKVSNNFSYYEVGEIQFKNENYKEDFEGGPRQPKLSKYLNPKFVETFGPILDKNNNPVLKDGKVQVTKNQKLFGLYSEYMDFQKESLISYGEYGLHNIYTAPQVSKTKFQDIQGILQGKEGSLKDMWLNLTRFRVDEQAFGAEFQGESLIRKANVRVLPKYFLRKLETEVSEDLFYTSALFAQQAELYKAKKERFSEFAVLNDKMMNRSYPEGKSADSTNTYKMFKSYMDYTLFGVKEMKQWRTNLPFIGQVDVTKVINWLHEWLKNNSLAVNVVVPLTSWITAETTLYLEKLLGQYVDKGSMRMAFLEMSKLSTAAIKEGLNIDSKAKLSIMGEYFGVFDINNRFEDSIYSKNIRSIGKAYYGLHTVANFVPLSKALLSQLYGHRIYGDKLVDFKKFEELHKLAEPTVTMETIKNNWENIKDKNLYNYIDIKDGALTYNYDKIAEDMGKVPGEEFKAEFRNLELGVAARIKKLIERIDGQIHSEDRTVLQRHVLGRFTMTHKAWLSIAASTRFKRKHFNMQTGQQEEGSYLSVMNTFTKAINKGRVEGGIAGVMKNLKEVYKNADPMEQENIRRVMIDSAFMSGLFALTLAISGWADDDKESLTAQFVAYMFERTVNETSSSQFGVLGEFYASSKEPIVGLSKIENLAKIADAFDSDIVKSGRYKGMEKREVYAIKNLIGAKSFYDLSSAENLYSQRKAYDFFNKEEMFTPIAWFIDNNGEKEED